MDKNNLISLYERRISETDNNQSRIDWLKQYIDTAKTGDMADILYYIKSTDMALESAMELERKILSL